ncbi:MAG TPA: rhamnan synthesis F family protein [Vicinamibacterales bacterium]|nr:rhamnan synthesis F family protein [Vicinamibacterales bacterium]
MLEITTARSYHSAEDCEIDSRLLEASGLLDVTSYAAAAGLETPDSAAKHYLLHGWRANLEPNPEFDGRFLYPYYRSVGLDGPPALTFLLLRAAGWPVYATRVQAQAMAATISSSGFFDPVSYTTRAGGLKGLDPLLHYVLVGEQMGLAPSTEFDAEYYRDRYPDVSGAAMNRLAHYVAFGRAEGRRRTSVSATLTFDRRRLDPSRETILLIVHDASRTGAPIIAYNIALRLRQKYNIVALLLGAGELFPDFESCCAAVIGPIPQTEWRDVEARHLVRRLCASYPVRYAIANSIETRMMLPSLAHAHVPVVTLVHEFASYTRPARSMGQALDWSTHVVFPAPLVAASAQREHPTLQGRTIHVLPQGSCPAPPPRGVRDTARTDDALRELFRQKESERALIVFGCGTVHIRKGVDLFLSCAAAVARLETKRPVRFVWIGAGYQPEDDPSYSCYLADQIERARLGTIVSIVDALADVEPAYALADVFFLSSRLDPLPNVTIDAALRGIPVVCFEDATGMADLLTSDPLVAQCVVPYLDVNRAAHAIARLADNEAERVTTGEATRRIAQATFDTDRYVERLDELGNDAVRIMQQRKEDFHTLREDPLFDASVYVHPTQPPFTRDEAIGGFLSRWLAVGLLRRPASNGLFRRPCVGFHPQIYAHENRDRYDASCVNPLAHFIRDGRPEGPWCHDVIVPRAYEDEPAPGGDLKVALHGHFFYPELAAELLSKLRINRAQCDLVFTTDDERKAQVIGAAARGYDRGTVLVHVVPNRGRDIGPLLTALGDDLLRDYDIVGHVHGKRSVAFDDEAMGYLWREFLWQHLVGDGHRMMDLILARFAEDEGLGIVFPDDPHLSDWDDNHEIAADLATRMGIEAPLPPYFDFPIGTMFWARTKALAPLVGLGLEWSDYPVEPVPRDGTILHAIERLLPFAARHAGYEYATTHVPGVTR